MTAPKRAETPATAMAGRAARDGSPARPAAQPGTPRGPEHGVPGTKRGTKPLRKAPEPQPVTVHLHRPLLDAVRALYPEAHDWTDNQVAEGCVALAIRSRVRHRQAAT